jgi:hypothetical protein
MGLLYAPVPGRLRPGTFRAFAPCTALSHNRVRPCCGPYATQSETPKESAALCPRELTGENSPHYTNQPTKTKTDRVLVKYFFAGTRLCGKCLRPVEYPTLEGLRFTEGKDSVARVSRSPVSRRSGEVCRAHVGRGAGWLQRNGRCGGPVPSQKRLRA